MAVIFIERREGGFKQKLQILCFSGAFRGWREPYILEDLSESGRERDTLGLSLNFGAFLVDFIDQKVSEGEYRKKHLKTSIEIAK